MSSQTTPRVFLDVEEAISREIRRITFQNTVTRDKTILQDTFDPFTGDVVVMPIEPKFYDSSADASHIQYPNFFVKLIKTREDRFTKRVLPEYGKWIQTPNQNAPGAYSIILTGIDGVISAPGNTLTTTVFQIRKIQPGYLIRLLTGNNIGTYYVSSITPNLTGDHVITVASTLVQNLPTFLFNPTTRIIYFQSSVDLFTVKVGDIFTDSTSVTFNITAVDPNAGTITIDGVTTPSLLANSTISRNGNVFLNSDLSPIRFIVMDPSQPIQVAGILGLSNQKGNSEGVSPQIPIDAYYLVRIDSKTRENHIDILNRVWEEFNPPRTALPIIQRSALSAEQLFTADIPTGGSNIVQVANSSNFSVGDQVFIIDQYHPTKLVSGEGFERPFQSTIVAIPSLTQLQLADTVPDTYLYANESKIISNCEFNLYMFHFVDHATKDVEGSQYWVHEFTFWVQIWIDRLEQPKSLTAVTDIVTPIEDLQGNIIFDEN